MHRPRVHRPAIRQERNLRSTDELINLNYAMAQTTVMFGEAYAEKHPQRRLSIYPNGELR